MPKLARCLGLEGAWLDGEASSVRWHDGGDRARRAVIEANATGEGVRPAVACARHRGDSCSRAGLAAGWVVQLLLDGIVDRRRQRVGAIETAGTAARGHRQPKGHDEPSNPQPARPQHLYPSLPLLCPPY